MKIQVTMKDPDVLWEAINDTLDESKPDNLTDEEWELVRESRAEGAREIAGKWFEYGEYLTVEIDTEAKTCVVLEAKS